uniref:Uncharacterized protein n=1 Tax=Setaria italica TaxID=4555 RepID=K3Y1P5_SETIT
NNQINLVLWGSRATDFDAEGVHSVGQESPVVAIFVGMLLKSYKGSACKWYINEEIPEIEKFFDQYSSFRHAGEQQFKALEQQKNLEEKTVLQLRDMDPWEFEVTLLDLYVYLFKVWLLYLISTYEVSKVACEDRQALTLNFFLPSM